MKTLTLVLFLLAGIYSAYAQSNIRKKVTPETTIPSDNKNSNTPASGVPINTVAPDNSPNTPSGNNPDYYQPPMPTADQPINEPQNTPTHPTEAVEPVYPTNNKKTGK